MNILLIDAHPMFRFGARELVRDRWSEAIVFEAGGIGEAERSLAARGMDLIVLDPWLPDASAGEALARALAAAGGCPVLVASASADSGRAARLLVMGARGFVGKDRPADAFSVALGMVAGGGRHVPPEVADRLVQLLSGATAAYFSDRGRPRQADRGRLNKVAVAALGKRAGTDLTVAQSSTISLKRCRRVPMS